MSKAPLEERLHMEVAGEGPLVLLAHGFAGSARNFRPQVRALRERHRVVTWDARGQARSPVPADGDYSLDALVSDLGAVLEHVGGSERAVVGGLSMGAATALHFALRDPSRVRGLVLASIPAGGGAVGSIATPADVFAEAIERDGLEAAGERFVWGRRSGFDEAGARMIRQGFMEHSPEGSSGLLRGALSELPRPEDIASRLRDLRVPALIVAGAEDSHSLHASRSLASLLPDSRLEVVEAAGHVVNLEAPGEFNRGLVDFIESL
jgi:pimeloyl-ACP methyl ester carboxylesterase